MLASDLLSMDEKTFTELRRATWPPTKRPDHPGPAISFHCTLCGGPLSLTRLRRDGVTKNRFFGHRHPLDEKCPWLHRNRLTPDQIAAIQYFGQHEGELHRRLKHFIADAMQEDPETVSESVIVDRFQIGKVLRGERKRPDVRATWREHPLVFEMQLSYTFISEVVKRDYFYQNEGSFVMWVFHERRSDRAMVIDEEFYNRRNLFVLDSEAEVASKEAGRLVLHCFYNDPYLDEELRAVVDVTKSAMVMLDDLTFPVDGLRPYYIDSDALLKPLEDRLSVLLDEDQERARRRQTYTEERKKEVKDDQPVGAESLSPESPPALQSFRERLDERSAAWARVYDELVLLGRLTNVDPNDTHDAGALRAAINAIPDLDERRDAELIVRYPFLQTMFKLISTKTGQTFGTKFKTVYEILAASLQKGDGQTTQKHMALLYLAAWEAYQPAMKPDQRNWMRDRATYHRDEAIKYPNLYSTDAKFERTVRILFPEMIQPLDGRLYATEVSKLTLIWSLRIDKTKVAQIGKQYLVTHPETNWRQVYSRALDACRAGVSVADLVEDISNDTDARSGDIRNFLVAATLAYAHN